MNSSDHFFFQISSESFTFKENFKFQFSVSKNLKKITFFKGLIPLILLSKCFEFTFVYKFACKDHPIVFNYDKIG